MESTLAHIPLDFEPARRERQRRGRTRKNEDKQEAVFKPDIFKERKQKLMNLCRALTDASSDFGSAVANCAEDCGLNASTVRRIIVAEAKDKMDGLKKQHEQLQLLLELS